MDNENVTQVPYIVYESEQSRNERIIKRLLIALVIAVVLLCVSNLVWLRQEMQKFITKMESMM